MRNLKLEIEYDGTAYAGWQVQNHLAPRAVRRAPKTIQETLEKTLQKILQEKIRLIASGRTDAGVHALAQVANFKTDSRIPTDKLQLGLNSLLPDDIVVRRIEEVSPDFHSRFSAKSKVYRYLILNRAYPSALLRDRVYFYPYPLDVALMRKEARSLLGKHDFRAFCASGSSVENKIRTIGRITIKKVTYHLSLITYHLKDDFLISIEIEADGFLYNMARRIAGTLIEVGRGRFPQGSLRKILLSRQRNLSGPNVPARGLCLMKVKY